MAGPPFVLEHFEPVRRLGGGGFGDVWLARQTNVDREVAVKVGHAPIDDRHVQMRFERECKALGRLSGHPNIIEVFTAGQLGDGRPYLVLEYVSGGTLWQRVQQGPVPEADLCRIAIQLSDALDLAHTTGVLHRDLKPENVLLRPNGEAVLGDFGIARLHDGANTTSHAITASVAYAAPEILSGQAASVASDIYGIGICLLASVIRRVPFVDNTDQTIHPIINRVLTDSPPRLDEYGLSAGFVELLGELLAKDPARRPTSAADVKRRLEAVLRSAAPAPPADGRRPAAQTRAVGSFPPHPPPGQPVRQPNPFAPPDQAGSRNPQVTGGSGHPAPSYSPGLPLVGHQPAGGQGRPGRTPGLPAGESSRTVVFAAAFGGTVLIGGLILLIALQVDRGGAPTSSTLAGGETTTTTTSTTTTQDPDVTVARQGELVLPITLIDLDYGDNATVDPDFIGPASPQFCDNTPATTGIDDWEGETITSASGVPAFFQELIRFSTDDQATDFLDAYVGTVTCEEWALPSEDGTFEIIFRPVVDSDPPALGDAARAIDYVGESDGLSIHARLVLVQSGTDVYMVSLVALTPAVVDDLDGLVSTAASRLGY